MRTYNWKQLMQELNTFILSNEEVTEFDKNVREKHWMGFEGATEDEIRALEKRLGCHLPPDYRSFLSYSNGWEGIVTSFIQNLFPVSDIGWFRDLNNEWLEIELQTAEEHKDIPNFLVLTYEQHIESRGKYEGVFHATYLKNCLQISEIGRGGSGVFLLNPSVVSEDGEWEAWFLASWLPGAERYVSFWEMIIDQFNQMKNLFGSQ